MNEWSAEGVARLAAALFPEGNGVVPTPLHPNVQFVAVGLDLVAREKFYHASRNLEYLHARYELGLSRRDATRAVLGLTDSRGGQIEKRFLRILRHPKYRGMWREA